jgi:hypothetical protein
MKGNDTVNDLVSAAMAVWLRAVRKFSPELNMRMAVSRCLISIDSRPLIAHCCVGPHDGELAEIHREAGNTAMAGAIGAFVEEGLNLLGPVVAMRTLALVDSGTARLRVDVEISDRSVSCVLMPSAGDPAILFCIRPDDEPARSKTRVVH